MTQQFSDIMLYKDTSWSLDEATMERYFREHPITLPESVGVYTALWRGYIGVFAIKSDKLYVENMFMLGEHDHGHPKTSVLLKAFPREEDRYLAFTGFLLLYGDYVRGGWSVMDMNEYERYELLQMADGKFIEARSYDHPQLLRFKDEQTEYFKLTDEYQLLKEEKRKRIAEWNTENSRKRRRDPTWIFSDESFDDEIREYILSLSKVFYADQSSSMLLLHSASDRRHSNCRFHRPDTAT